MIIKDYVEYEDGSCEFKFFASSEETSFLINHAVMDLISRGIIQISTEAAEQEFEIYKKDGGKLN